MYIYIRTKWIINLNKDIAKNIKTLPRHIDNAFYIRVNFIY